MSVAPASGSDEQKCLQTSPNVCWEAKPHPAENHSSRGKWLTPLSCGSSFPLTRFSLPSFISLILCSSQANLFTMFDLWRPQSFPNVCFCLLLQHTQQFYLAPNTTATSVFFDLLDKCNCSLAVHLSYHPCLRILSFLFKSSQHPLRFSAYCWYSRNIDSYFLEYQTAAPIKDEKICEVPYQTPF